jgi:fructokinase
VGHAVVAYGEVLWDLLPSGAVLGGAPFNFIYRINTLGDSGVIVSRLGEDDLGRKALGRIEELGICSSYIQRDDKHPTGTVKILFDDSKNPDINILPDVAYDYIEPDDGILELASAADCLCFGTLIQRGRVSRDTLEQLLKAFRGRLILLDINLRRNCFTAESILSSIENAHVLKLNDGEAAILAQMYGVTEAKSFGPSIRVYIPDLADTLFARSHLEVVVVTLGGRGAFAASRNGQRIYCPGHAVNMEDPLGCGDAFSAAFIHKLLREASLVEACKYGNAFGALVATQQGATKPLNPRDAETFLSRVQHGLIEKNLREFLVQE